jgi:hypothetical protein
MQDELRKEGCLFAHDQGFRGLNFPTHIQEFYTQVKAAGACESSTSAPDRNKRGPSAPETSLATSSAAGNKKQKQNAFLEPTATNSGLSPGPSVTSPNSCATPTASSVASLHGSVGLTGQGPSGVTSFATVLQTSTTPTAAVPFSAGALGSLSVSGRTSWNATVAQGEVSICMCMI